MRGEKGGGGRRENKGESGEREVWTERVISITASDTASLNAVLLYSACMNMLPPPGNVP